MAGHSHWKQIKIKKATSDQKRGVLFSKLLNAIAIAARGEPNPQFNPRLRTAIEKAREANIPQDNIERAIKRSGEAGAELEEIIIEAYGPEGTALLVQTATNNKNRTIQEMKTILKNYQAKWAEPGSVLWTFEKTSDAYGWRPKFAKEISEEGRKKINELINALENHEDVQSVFTNAV